MSKLPDIVPIEAGPDQTSRINYNLTNIARHFGTLLSREPEIPNFMLGNLDVSDAEITNVRVTNVKTMTVSQGNPENIENYLMYRIFKLPTVGGDILYAPADNEITNGAIGNDNDWLRVTDGLPLWGQGDQDTLGVNIYEDGVLVLENVRRIDFVQPDFEVTTDVPPDRVDIELGDLWGFALWEDRRNTDNQTNIYSHLGAGNDYTTVDLITDVGLTREQIDSGQYYFLQAIDHEVRDNLSNGPNGPASGNWQLTHIFLAEDGVTVVPGGGTVQDGTDGGGPLLHYNIIPVGARTVLSRFNGLALFPLFLTFATIFYKYRKVARLPVVTDIPVD